MTKTRSVILETGLKLMTLFLFALAIGCDNEKDLPGNSAPVTEVKVARNTPPKEQQDILKRELEKKSYSLMHIDLGTKIDYTDKALLESLGVYDAKEGTNEDVLYFKPKKTFRKFNEYLMKVDVKTQRVTQVFAISKQDRNECTTEQAKNEVGYIISLLKRKYGLSEDSYVSVDHRGGSPLYDEWLHTVQIDERYRFTVARAFSTATGWTFTIRLIDTVPDMTKDDVDAL